MKKLLNKWSKFDKVDCKLKWKCFVPLNLILSGQLSNMFSFSLTAACAFRYNGLSFVYLIYLLLIPLFAEPSKATMQGKKFIASFFRVCGGQSACKSFGVVEGEAFPERFPLIKSSNLQNIL